MPFGKSKRLHRKTWDSVFGEVLQGRWHIIHRAALNRWIAQLLTYSDTDQSFCNNLKKQKLRIIKIWPFSMEYWCDLAKCSGIGHAFRLAGTNRSLILLRFVADEPDNNEYCNKHARQLFETGELLQNYGRGPGFGNNIATSPSTQRRTLIWLKKRTVPLNAEEISYLAKKRGLSPLLIPA